MPRAYYNEFDDYAADWLENLIDAGLLPDGDVDRRSIEDVTSEDLKGYTQAHFFAGIGGWPLSLRKAGWPDDRSVWTGSCPCPPFSKAGKGTQCPSCGSASCFAHPLVTAGWVCVDCGDEWRGDDRHLLPEFIRLIGDSQPSAVFGEQVASSDGVVWLYTFRTLMEAQGYAFGAADLCAAGIGAPHIRQRLFFGAKRLGDTDKSGFQGWKDTKERVASGEGRIGTSRLVGGLADSDEHGSGGRRVQRPGQGDGAGLGASRERFAGFRATSGLDDTASARHIGTVAGAERDSRNETRLRVSGEGRGLGGLAESDGWFSGDGHVQPSRQHRQQPENGRSGELDNRGRPSPTNSIWRDVDWLFCRDGKWRPVEPGTFPLADGISGRVGRIRAYGNAIVPEVGATFVKAWMQALEDI